MQNITATRLNKIKKCQSNEFSLLAFVIRGRHIIAARNGEKSSPKFVRYYTKTAAEITKTATPAYMGHAEMILADRINSNSGDTFYVARKNKKNQYTMAKPCVHCQAFLKKKGWKSVYYTDWDGKWKRLML